MTSPQPKRILVLGASGVGKSTTCNALVNGDVTRTSLSSPFLTGNGRQGCTKKLTKGESEDLILYDPVGLNQPKWDDHTRSLDILNTLQLLKEGINGIFVIIAQQREPEKEGKMLRMFFRLLGSHLQAKTVLVVTHCEDGSNDGLSWVKSETKKEEKDGNLNFLVKKCKGGIVCGLWQSNRDDKKDAVFKPGRQNFLDSLTERYRQMTEVHPINLNDPVSFSSVLHGMYQILGSSKTEEECKYLIYDLVTHCSELREEVRSQYEWINEFVKMGAGFDGSLLKWVEDAVKAQLSRLGIAYRKQR